MKFTAALLGATLAGVSLTGGSAFAGVVTFDDAVGDSLLYQIFTYGQSFSDQGLTFTNNGEAMYVWPGDSPNSNGTNNNIFGFNGGDYESITKTGGGAFNLISLDLAISWYDPNPTEVITINGAPLTITQTLTDYTLDLTGVTQVNISGVASGSGYWTADNVTFSSGVPEASTWAMMLLGFAGLGFAGYRQTRKNSISLAA